VDGRIDEFSGKTKTPEQKLQAAAERTGGFPPGMNLVVMEEFIRGADKFIHDTLGEAGDKNMWSEFDLIIEHPIFLPSSLFVCRHRRCSCT